MDPLLTTQNVRKEYVLKNPGANQLTIDLSIDFLDDSNNICIGNFYVVAQALPVHYTLAGENACIDSIGPYKFALFKLNITSSTP